MSLVQVCCLTDKLVNIRDASLGNNIPFTKVFMIRGIGYQADIVEVKEAADFPFARYLSLRLGHSSLICQPIPNHLGVKIAHKDRKITLYSNNKDQLSNFAMTIFKLRPPSVYTGRGVRIKKGIHRRKLGKKDIRKGKV